MKLLLVDDDAFLRDLYATKFSEASHEVIVAKSGEEALKTLQKTTVDVVLADVVMPGMTGCELVKQIKAGDFGNPMCIMLSNQSEESDRKAAEEAGAIGYIVKAEMVPSEVVAEVQKIVSQ